MSGATQDNTNTQEKPISVRLGVKSKLIILWPLTRHMIYAATQCTAFRENTGFVKIRIYILDLAIIANQY